MTTASSVYEAFLSYGRGATVDIAKWSEAHSDQWRIVVEVNKLKAQNNEQ